MSKPLFVEQQYMRQWWLWAIILGICLPVIVSMAYLGYRQLVFDIPMGNRPVPNSLLGPFILAISVLLLGIPALIALCHLSVEVQPDVLVVRYWPFSNRCIPISEIASCEVRTFRPIREYGGWGIRYSWTNGMAYNVRGNRGVQLALRNGKRVLIGSQRPDELLTAIRRMQK